MFDNLSSNSAQQASGELEVQEFSDCQHLTQRHEDTDDEEDSTGAEADAPLSYTSEVARQ
jgi:hypothetical protein